VAFGVACVMCVMMVLVTILVVIPAMQTRSTVDGIAGYTDLYNVSGVYPPDMIEESFGSTSRAVNRLTFLYKHGPGEDNRWVIPYILGGCGDEAKAPLLEMAKDPDPWVQLTTGASLAHIGALEGVILLRRLVSHPTVMVRMTAVKRLAEIKDPPQIEALVQCVRGKDVYTRDAALKCIDRILGDKIIYLINAYYGVWTSAGAGDRFRAAQPEEIRKRLRDPRALAFLIYMLKDESIEEDIWRGDAAYCLAWAPLTKVEDVLIEALGSTSIIIQENAAFALMLQGSKRAQPLFIKMLGAQEPRVRRAGAAGLGFVGDQKAYKALLPLKEDSDPEVRKAVRASLDMIKKNPNVIWRFEGVKGTGKVEREE